MKTKSEEVAAIRSKADEELEKLVAQGVKVRPKDAWKKTIGTHKNDPYFESAVRLGAEWRRQQTWEKENADS